MSLIGKVMQSDGKVICRPSLYTCLSQSKGGNNRFHVFSAMLLSRCSLPALEKSSGDLCSPPRPTEEFCRVAVLSVKRVCLGLIAWNYPGSSCSRRAFESRTWGNETSILRENGGARTVLSKKIPFSVHKLSPISLLILEILSPFIKKNPRFSHHPMEYCPIVSRFSIFLNNNLE